MIVKCCGGGERPEQRAGRIVSGMILTLGLASLPAPLLASEIDLETNIACGTYFEMRGEVGAANIAYENGLSQSTDKEEFKAVWEENYQNIQYDLDRWFELEGPCRELFSPKKTPVAVAEEEPFSIPPHLAHVTYERAIACGTQFEILNLEGHHLFVLAYNVAAALAGDGADLAADKQAATDQWLFKTPQKVFEQSVDECRAEFKGSQ